VTSDRSSLSLPSSPAAFPPAGQAGSLLTLLNSMAEGVLLLDRDGRVQLTNQALERMFGLSGDLRGRTVMEALRLHEVKDLARQAAAEGQVLGFELSPPGLDERCLQLNATALRDEQGQAQGVVLVFHDLTRLKQLEKTRTEFVANVSHELRTPLSLIKGCVETLLDGAKDDPAVATRFLQIIQKHTDRLVFLIEDLLVISRLESGQVALDRRAVSLRPLVERTLNDLKARAEEREVSLANEVPEGLCAFADAERLQQVLYNLVDNAIKYGRQRGQVLVTGRPGQPNEVELSVQDDGPGIPPGSQERIFERFYRVDRARSPEQGGTGLGLAIVKHIVQSHGGRVWVKSELEKGAAFYFTLPAADQAPPDLPQP
jgi:two-component system phosphate regulon sensor histidine kinase PhoR